MNYHLPSLSSPAVSRTSIGWDWLLSSSTIGGANSFDSRGVERHSGCDIPQQENRTMPKIWTIIAAAALLPCVTRADVQTKRVEYEHAGHKLEGTLAWDDSISGKRPGVLVVHEWWGLDDYARTRAEQLAQLGYVAFAADMYGKGKLTEHPQEAMQWSGQIRENIDNWRARALAGLKVLESHELVDTKRLAAIGYCFGGATVTQLAYAGVPLAGVVSFHGSLPAATPEQAKHVKAQILVCHGALDTFVSEAQAQKFRDSLKDAAAPWQMIYYAGAKHSFTNPGADAHGVPGLAYNKLADERSWADMRAFFDEIFARE
jgi:dienelactone hydrolase